MSIIPSAAVSAALSPLQSQSNEAVRARKVQLEKNIHEAQDILELDDSAVDSISDHNRKHNADQNPRHDSKQPSLSEEHVEIASLQPRPGPAPTPPATTSPLAHLDISA